MRSAAARPYSPLGVTVALQDCEDHKRRRQPALLENVLSHGSPFESHDNHDVAELRGRPVARLDDARTDVLPLGRARVAWRAADHDESAGVESCAVRAVSIAQAIRANEMETYPDRSPAGPRDPGPSDAQYGGPGRGWFRIVSSPADARAVARRRASSPSRWVWRSSEGRSAAACETVSRCAPNRTSAGLDELYAMAGAQVILTHKVDNAFGGVRFDQV